MNQEVVSFVLRFVREGDNEQARWRGVIKHVQSDDTADFARFNDALEFMQERVNDTIRQSFASDEQPTPDKMFAETARLAREHSEADVGVHLSLVAEHEACRWGPLTGDASLRAPDGGMWRDAASAVEHVSVEAARTELRAQVEHALAAGVDVTHIDTHTEALFHPKFIRLYVDLALEYRLPLFFFRANEPALEVLRERAAAYLDQLRRLDERGWPLLDHVIARTMLEIEPEVKVERFRRFFAGLTLFITHPALAGEELAAIDPIGGRFRAKEGEIFSAPEMRAYCESLGIRLVGYRELRERLRAG